MENNQTPAEQPVTAAVAPEAAPAAPQFDPVSIDYFMKLKFRVAEITAVERVEKSKKLLKLQLNLGEKLGTRQIVSGIAQFYEPEKLVGRKIVVIANLEPAKLMGIESQGMLLAASTDDVSQLVLLDPGQDMPAGSEVR